MYSREFELDLVSFCLSKPLYLRQHRKRLQKLKFQDKFINIVYENIFKCLNDYGTLPTETELKKIVSDKMSENERFTSFEVEVANDIVTDVCNRKVTDITGMTVGNILVKEEANKIGEDFTTLSGEEISAKLKEYEHRLAKLSYVTGSKDEDLGLNFFSRQGLEEAKKLLEAYSSEDCFSSGFTIWDRQLQGGFRKGELCVILAPTGVGKTTILLNLAANLLRQDYRVVYIALDNLSTEMISRSVGCLMDRDITEALDPEVTMEEIHEAYGKHFKNNFWIKHFAPRELTKTKLESYLDKLKIHLYDLDKANGIVEEECGRIDCLVLDYLDCMLSESGAGEFWIAAEHLAQDLKGTLKNYKLLGLTATQGGTEAMKSDTLKLHMAQGAKSRFNAPDLVFGISQSEDEKKMRPASKFRITCLKARRAKNSYEIMFDFYKEKQVVREDPAYSDVLQTMSSSSGKVNEDGTPVESRNSYTQASQWKFKKEEDPVEKILYNASQTLEVEAESNI